jgi:hypothetical protein
MKNYLPIVIPATLLLLLTHSIVFFLGIMAPTFLTVYKEIKNPNQSLLISKYGGHFSMCHTFADDYLNMMKEKYSIETLAGEKWESSIAVETDIFNLCNLELTEESLSNYNSYVMKKYTKEN